MPEDAERRPALDAVRGLAIALVVLVHFGTPHAPASDVASAVFFALVDSGWVGVDLFFVLSGYLITRNLLRARERPHYFRNFYARRALRILPLYWGWLALTFFVLVHLVPGGRPVPWTEQLWYWAFLANVHVAAHWGPSTLVHFWSLAVEEHFYAVWPFVVRWLRPARLLVACVAVAVVAFASRAWLWHSGADARWIVFFTLCRLDALAAGGMLAAAERWRGGLEPLARPVRLCALLGGAAIALLLVEHGRLSWTAPTLAQATVQYTAVAALSTALVAHAASTRPTPLLRWPPLVALGEISYGVYVMHLFVNWAFSVFVVSYAPPVRAMLPWWALLAQIATMLVATSALAWISYRFYERRWLALKRHFGGPESERSR
ncbi:MAG: acyltransferase [Myxococcota bacterium]|nr:acyltransferase [Myxococcota bacterium]MDW8363374.1 acyltransferase [Myxococcales bacterium]